MIATIAEKKNFSHRSDHKETTLQRSLESSFHMNSLFLSAIVAITAMVAIIWNLY